VFLGRDPEVGTPVIGDWQHPVGHLLRKVVFLHRTLADFKVGERRQRLVRPRGKRLAARCNLRQSCGAAATAGKRGY
jgi:hypothetical protein